jgi:hypothetical protein
MRAVAVMITISGLRMDADTNWVAFQGSLLSRQAVADYCGAGLRCCRSLKSSAYNPVRLAFSLACALHPGLFRPCGSS